MTRRFAVAAALASAALLPVAASATTTTINRTVVYDNVFGFVANPALVPKFNLAGQTLKSVAISANFNFIHSATVTNLAPFSSAIFDVTSTSVASFSTDTGRSFSGAASRLSVGSVTGGGSVPVLFAYSDNPDFLLNSGLTDFTGAGDITFTLNPQVPFLQLVSRSPGISLKSVVNRDWRVFSNLQVVYESVPTVAGVPEPASWAMLILGFGLIGTGMRRQRRVAA